VGFTWNDASALALHFLVDGASSWHFSPELEVKQKSYKQSEDFVQGLFPSHQRCHSPIKQLLLRYH
jgi:hypothetical protein